MMRSALVLAENTNQEERTLGTVLNDALVAVLGARREAKDDPPFDLVVRGDAGGRFPTPADMAAGEAPR